MLYAIFSLTPLLFALVAMDRNSVQSCVCPALTAGSHPLPFHVLSHLPLGMPEGDHFLDVDF